MAAKKCYRQAMELPAVCLSDNRARGYFDVVFFYKKCGMFSNNLANEENWVGNRFLISEPLSLRVSC